MKDGHTFIGIDPGMSGAIAFLGMGYTHVQTLPITGSGKARELDVRELKVIIMHFRGQTNTVILEKVHSMPGQGVSSTFKFGKVFGQLDATVKCCKLAMVLVTPQAWKKEVLKGMDWKGNKAASIQYCQTKYPSIDLKRSPRCKTPHDGICDAICMAEYGMIKYA